MKKHASLLIILLGIILLISQNFGQTLSSSNIDYMSQESTNFNTQYEEITTVIDFHIDPALLFIQNTETGQEIHYEDYGRLQHPGEPYLPSKILSIALPPNAQFIQYSVLNGEKKTLPGTYAVTPIQQAQILSENTEVLQQHEDDYPQRYTAIYQQNEPYPTESVEFQGISGYRKYNLIDFRICPFTYQPLNQTLSYYTQATLSITYTEKQDTQPQYHAESTYETTTAQRLIYNYKEAQQWYQTSSQINNETFDLVIITLDSLTETITPLVEWEKQKGKTVHVVTIEWIEQTYTSYDTAGKIRTFLREKYPSNAWNIHDVLIIGNYSEIPLRTVYQGFPGESYPETDYYYAELSLSDEESWDIDGDHKYAENTDSFDYYAEVTLGRIPWSNPEIVARICQKSINYEQNTDPSFKQNILLLAAFVDDRTDGATYAEYLVNSSIHPWMNQWMKTKLYDRGSIYPKDAVLNHVNVVSTWSQGTYAFVAWHAHGSPYGSGGFISIDDCQHLNDDYPAIISAASCSNSDTDFLNIGQAMLRQGAVGFLGANKAAYYRSEWDHPDDGSDQSFKYLFSSAVTSGAYTQGAALQYAIQEMYTRGLWDNIKYETLIHSSLWGNPNLGMQTYSPNDKPDTPTTPSGPSSGKINAPQEYRTQTIDANDDSIYYCWDWGDGTIDWVGPYTSGQEISATHTWRTEGSYTIKVKAKDSSGSESNWSAPLEVAMPKTHSFTLLHRLHPMKFSMFNTLFSIYQSLYHCSI